MKPQGLALCAMFLLLGCMWGAKTELATLQRVGGEITWAMLFSPVSLVNIVTPGFAAVAALMTKSPLTQKLVFKAIGLEEDSESAESEPETLGPSLPIIWGFKDFNTDDVEAESETTRDAKPPRAGTSWMVEID
jgi:hypothetical protein